MEGKKVRDATELYSTKAARRLSHGKLSAFSLRIITTNPPHYMNSTKIAAKNNLSNKVEKNHWYKNTKYTDNL